MYVKNSLFFWEFAISIFVGSVAANQKSIRCVLTEMWPFLLHGHVGLQVQEKLL